MARRSLFDQDHPVWHRDHPIWPVLRMMAAGAAALAIHWAGAASFDGGEVASALGTMAVTAAAMRK